MKVNFNKIFIGMLSLLAIAATKGQAHHYSPGNQYDSGDYIYDSTGDQYNSGGYSCDPRCGPQCCNDQLEWFVDAELLYWRPRLCGLENAFARERQVIVNGPITEIATSTRAREPRYHWNAGFRIGAGISLDCNDDIQLYWTHFNGKAKPKNCGARGRWKVDYDVVDLTYGRTFCVCDFEMRPYVGVRFARIDQKLRSAVLNSSTLDGVPSTVLSVNRFKDEFKGVAPEVGVNAVWNMGSLGCGGSWSLFGDIAVAGYYGQKDVRQRSAQLETTAVIARRFRSNAFLDSVATDVAFGFGWETPFSGCGCDNMTFSLRFGVEQHRIYDFNNCSSTLSLAGVNLSARLGF